MSNSTNNPSNPSTRKPRKTITKFQYQSRIEELHRLILHGYSRQQVISKCVQQWGLSDRQARRYIQAAYQTFAETVQQDREILVGLAFERLNALYATAQRRHDFPTMLAAVQEMNNVILNIKPAADKRLRGAVKRLQEEDSFKNFPPDELRHDIIDGWDLHHRNLFDQDGAQRFAVNYSDPEELDGPNPYDT